MKLDLISSTKNDTTFSLSMRAQTACARAKGLEETGDFEDAREALSEFWQRIGQRPRVEGLDEIGRAEVLLRAGALSGWLGSAQQITGAQEIAKDLISEGVGAFEKLGLVERVAEARVDLAICYLREGAFDEARITLDEALYQLGNLESEQRLRVLLNRAIVEKVSHCDEDALKTHREAAPLFEASNNNALKGKFHNEYASILKNLGFAQKRDDYIDQALVEYSAARFYAEQAGNSRFLALVENNVGLLFMRLARVSDAQVHLDRARTLFTILKDKGSAAVVDDTRARALIDQGQFAEAEKLARGSVRVLEEGDELGLMAEALTTYGTALARLGNFSKARAAFEKAIRTAHQAGDPKSGGVSALSMAEELADHLPLSDLRTYYRMAESELMTSQQDDIQTRLGKCARKLLATDWSAVSNESAPVTSGSNGHTSASNDSDSPEPLPTTSASLEEQVLHYEGNLIKQALETADGSVTRAARMLGVTHQGLAFILNGRHKSLLAARKPVKRRRRSIIRFH
jgi:tetratricopeptide (TPR) repeat protein